MSRILTETDVKSHKQGSRQRFWREEASEFCGEEMQPFVALQPELTALPHEQSPALQEKAATQETKKNKWSKLRSWAALFSLTL